METCRASVSFTSVSAEGNCRTPVSKCEMTAGDSPVLVANSAWLKAAFQPHGEESATKHTGFGHGRLVPCWSEGCAIYAIALTVYAVSYRPLFLPNSYTPPQQLRML